MHRPMLLAPLVPPPHASAALTALGRAVLVATLALAIVGCRSPRDPDLEQQLSRARADQAKPASNKAPPPPPAPARVAEAAKNEPPGAPPVGVIELRSYTTDEIATIHESVAGDGPVFRATISTSDGDIRCELDTELAPQATANFIALAGGLKAWRDPDTDEAFKSRFYDNLSFHRTIANFIIQTGNPGTRAASGPGWKIPREDGNPARYDAPGAMGMVDAGDDTHGSQFFITVRAQKSLGAKYTPFGVCEDLALVGQIADAPKHPAAKEGKSATKPLRPVRVQKVTVSRGAAGPVKPDEPAAPSSP